MRPPRSPSRRPQSKPQHNEDGREKLFQRSLSQQELQDVVEQLIHANHQKDALLEQIGQNLISAQMQFSLLSRCMLDNNLIRHEHIERTMAEFRMATQLGNLLVHLAQPNRVGPSSPVNLQVAPDETPENVTRIFGD